MSNTKRDGRLNLGSRVARGEVVDLDEKRRSDQEKQLVDQRELDPDLIRAEGAKQRA
jgi:hypothetical protein